MFWKLRNSCVPPKRVPSKRPNRLPCRAAGKFFRFGSLEMLFSQLHRSVNGGCFPPIPPRKPEILTIKPAELACAVDSLRSSVSSVSGHVCRPSRGLLSVTRDSQRVARHTKRVTRDIQRVARHSKRLTGDTQRVAGHTKRLARDSQRVACHTKQPDARHSKSRTPLEKTDARHSESRAPHEVA